MGMGLEKYRRVNWVLYLRVTPTWVWGEVQTSQLGAISASNANLGMGLEKYRRVNWVLVTPTWVWGLEKYSVNWC